MKRSWNNRRVRIIVFFNVAFLLSGASLCASAQKELKHYDPMIGKRDHIRLNGDWESCRIRSSSLVAPESGWKKATVPSLVYGTGAGGTEYLWYRTTIVIPQEWQRMFIRLSGVRFDPRVFIDGKPVVTTGRDWTPTEGEITGLVVPGESATITVRCSDWSSLFSGGFVIPRGADSDSMTLRFLPHGKVLSPIGGHFAHFGIWDDAAVMSVPPVHIKNVVIRTSVRKQLLDVSGVVSGMTTGGEDGFNVKVSVLDGDQPALPGHTAELTARGTFRLETKFPNAKLWSPETPHLYTLTLELSDKSGRTVYDISMERFGFREVWTDGPDIYVNEIKRHFLASSTWPVTRYQSDDEIRASLRAMKDGNIIAFRLHTQPWQKRWIELADELGMFIIEEGALWCDGGGSYAYADPLFWNNYRAHLAGMVERDINHPSIVMWSLENELLHCGGERHDAAMERRLADLGKYMRSIDPTRLVTFEADLDPGGAADVIGLHYPHEMPEHADYPNTADWISGSVTTGTGGGLAGSRGADFQWKRDKPLYIGEYLWVFHDTAGPGSVFFGDVAYDEPESYKMKAKALAWFDQTIAYRRAGVSGMCPWTAVGDGGLIDTSDLLYLSQKRAYDKLAVFRRERSARVFTGSEVTRTFDVFNDTAASVDIVFEYIVPLNLDFMVHGERKTADGTIGRVMTPPNVFTEEISLAAGGRTTIPLTFAISDTQREGDYECDIRLVKMGGKARPVFVEKERLSVFARKPIEVPKGTTILLYDPAEKLMGNAGIERAIRIRDLDEVARRGSGNTILLVGPDAFGGQGRADGMPVIMGTSGIFPGFTDFLARGGRAIVLEQSNLSPLALGITLEKYPSTMNFAAGARHPVLEGMSSDDLKFWQSDHYVTRFEIVRPKGFGARSIAVSGGLYGVDHASIVEVPFGKGVCVLLQTLVGEKLGVEPAAQSLLRNAIAYLAAYDRHVPPVYTSNKRQTPDTRTTIARTAKLKVIVAAEKGEASLFARTLKYIGVDTEIADRPLVDLAGVSHLVLDGGGEHVAAALDLVARSADEAVKSLVVYWHLPDKALFDRYAKVLGFSGHEIVEASSMIKLNRESGPFIQGFFAEDLAFGRMVNRTDGIRAFEYDQGIIDRFVSPRRESLKTAMYEVELWKRDGHLVSLSKDKTQVAFLTNGSVTGTIDAEQTGVHLLTIDASGTAVRGVFPFVEVKIDSRIKAGVQLTGPTTVSYPVFLMLDKGAHEVTISFTNDSFAGNEDRNLMLDRISVARVGQGTVTYCTMPPALVLSAQGTPAAVVIDCIRWHENEASRTKALRFVNNLFANMGVGFLLPVPEPEWITPESFSPVGKIGYAAWTPSEVAFYTNGTISARFRCAGAGTYDIIVRGHSTPFQKVHARVDVSVDGRTIGTVEIASLSTLDHRAGQVTLGAGEHDVVVRFANDANNASEDRNLFFQGLGFRQ